ncbi:MAG: DJ-1/PfpI family protein [Thermoplasmata archaeon]
MTKVLILAGDATESLETLYPYQRLKEEGYEVDIAAPELKNIRTVIHDFEPGFDTYTEKPGYLVKTTKKFSDVRPEEYTALVIPGGRGPEYLRNHPETERIVRHFFETNKPVAHICHAPLILGSLGLLKNRKVAAYPELRKDVELAGGIFIDKEVVVDGNMVSSRSWLDHPAWMREFIKILKRTYPP